MAEHRNVFPDSGIVDRPFWIWLEMSPPSATVSPSLDGDRGGNLSLFDGQ